MTTDLVLMIFKTHTGEWLSATRMRAIVSAISGADVPLKNVKQAITRLNKQGRVMRSKTASAWMIFEG